MEKCPKCGSENIFTRYDYKTHKPIERFCIGKENEECDWNEEIKEET